MRISDVSILKIIKIANERNNKINIKHWYEWVDGGIG